MKREQALAAAFRAERAARDKNQSEVADIFGVHANTYAGWESGEGLPKTGLLPRVAQWLRVDGAELVRMIEEIGRE